MASERDDLIERLREIIADADGDIADAILDAETTGEQVDPDDWQVEVPVGLLRKAANTIAARPDIAGELWTVQDLAEGLAALQGEGLSSEHLEKADHLLAHLSYCASATEKGSSTTGNPATEAEWQDRHGLSAEETSVPVEARALAAETTIAAHAATISRLEAEVEAGWQPIETAPKDGSRLDLWHVEYGRYTDCHWGRTEHSCGEYGSYCDSDWHREPEGWVDGSLNQPIPDAGDITHWRLPPVPPRTEGERG